MQPTDVCKANVLKSSYKKIWSNILTARYEEQAHGATKWIKNNLLMIPPVDLIRVKNMLNLAHHFYELPWCCNCMLAGNMSQYAGSIQSNWGSVGELTIIIWRIIPGGWLITITANHSNYLVCDRANTQSVTVRKVVKLQLNYCNAS